MPDRERRSLVTAFSPRWRLKLAIVFLVAAPSHAGSTVPVEPARAPESFLALLDGLAAMPGFESRFVEEKSIALLVEPLKSEGRLFFVPPASLIRQTDRPHASEIRITPNEVILSEAGGTRTIDLASHDAVRPLVESILWIFSGDRAAIERAYYVDYRAGDELPSGAWTLTLVPRHELSSLLVRTLEIRGVGRSATSFEVVETSGDRTTTRLLDANPARVFTAEERERLFEIDGQ